jgi:hypothetical protein
MPFISGPAHPLGIHPFHDSFDFNNQHPDGVPTTHSPRHPTTHSGPTHHDLGNAGQGHDTIQQFLDNHPNIAAHLGHGQELAQHFLDNHPNIAAHLGEDSGGGLLAHNLPYWGHGDWAG